MHTHTHIHIYNLISLCPLVNTFGVDECCIQKQLHCLGPGISGGQESSFFNSGPIAYWQHSINFAELI